jgi:hypothetical protein
VDDFVILASYVDNGYRLGKGKMRRFGVTGYFGVRGIGELDIVATVAGGTNAIQIGKP